MLDERVAHLAATYGGPRLTLNDFAFMLDLHPLEIWCGGVLAENPLIDWSTLRSHSSMVRQMCSTLVVQYPKHRAQNMRLRTRIEGDAFERMTPAWRRLGFPFKKLVPSYATAIGNSSDRPMALAELMGIIINDGVRRPVVSVRRLRFGTGTPYETIFEPPRGEDARVLKSEVARALRGVLAEVVNRGTAQRVKDAVAGPDGAPLQVAGKTGSGDNRFKTVAPDGRILSDRAVSRTATFAFTIGDRHFGVITASVFGPRAEDYGFTSALPVTLLRLLAPAIERHLADEDPPASAARPKVPAAVAQRTG